MTSIDTSTAAVEARCQHLDHVAHDREYPDAALMRALVAERDALQVLHAQLPAQEHLPDCGADPVTVAQAVIESMRDHADKASSPEQAAWVLLNDPNAMSAMGDAGSDTDGPSIFRVRLGTALRAIAGGS